MTGEKAVAVRMAERVEVMSDEFLYCRMMNVHLFRPVWVAEALIPKHCYTHLAFRCTECGTIRVDGLDRNFNLSSRRYLHPDGYLMPRGEVPAKSMLRREFVARHCSPALTET